MIDLPEANAIQAYYLSRAMPEAKLRLRSDPSSEDFDFAILTPDCLTQFLHFEVVINIRSFAEMRRQTITEYFRFIQDRAKPGAIFYNVNRYSNGASGEWVKFKGYPYDPFWKTAYSAPAWTQPRIHELIAVRTEKPGDIRRVVRSLSGGNVGIGKILMGLGEHPRDPIARMRRMVGKTVRRWHRKKLQ